MEKLVRIITVKLMCGSSLTVFVVYRYTAFFEREYVTAGASLCSY